MDLAWEHLGGHGSQATSSLMSLAATQLQQVASTASDSIGTKEFGSEDGGPRDVWILGKKFNTKTDLSALKRQVRSRIWFSYRKDFCAIGDSGLTSDKGWGCMLRCGQMVVAECLQRRALGRDFKWGPSESCPQYVDLLPLFADQRGALYSVHQLSCVNTSQRPVGTWFGPNHVAHAIKKMSTFDTTGRIGVHVAMDNTLVISDVIKDAVKPGSGNWQPLLLFIPLRLGISEMNPTYCEQLKACFELEQCAGVIGGRPNHALYFIGYTGDELVCLDPHVTQSAVCVGSKTSDEEVQADSTYHTDKFYRLHVSQLDPSLALCYFCATEESFHGLCKVLKENVLGRSASPMFDVRKETLQISSDELLLAAAAGDTFEASDDEFEML